MTSGADVLANKNGDAQQGNLPCVTFLTGSKV